MNKTATFSRNGPARRRAWGLCLLALCVWLTGRATAGEVRYVILFIGDGMGENHRILYNRERPDNIFATEFPVTVRTGTDNSKGQTTDSAASGTAIACGVKTINGRLGLDAGDPAAIAAAAAATDKAEKKDPPGRPVTSLATLLRDRGWKIGLVSSSPINDATPAAHYAHINHRGQHKEIIADMAKSGFHYFGVSSFMRGNFTENAENAAKLIDKMLTDGGLVVTRSTDMSGLSPDDRNVVVTGSMATTYNDAPRKTPSLADQTARAIELLENDKGFFLMVENGHIDYAGHNNDSGRLIREFIVLEDAVKIALDFQVRHPDETIIIVTADHNTGGPQFIEEVTPRQPSDFLQQRAMKDDLLGAARPIFNANTRPEFMRAWIFDQLGLAEADLADEDRERLDQALAFYAERDDDGSRKAGMGNAAQAPILTMLSIRDRLNGMRWTTSGHTSEPILTQARGPGAELFAEPLENSDIPHHLAKLLFGSDEELGKPME